MGAVVGNDNYKLQYVDQLVKDWDIRLYALSTIAQSQPQAPYLAFMRSISDTSDSLPPIKTTIQKWSIGGPVPNEEERKLLSLPIWHRLAITIFHEQTEIQYTLEENF